MQTLRFIINIITETSLTRLIDLEEEKSTDSLTEADEPQSKVEADWITDETLASEVEPWCSTAVMCPSPSSWELKDSPPMPESKLGDTGSILTEATFVWWRSLQWELISVTSLGEGSGLSRWGWVTDSDGSRTGWVTDSEQSLSLLQSEICS